MKEHVSVIKIGGNVLNDPVEMKHFLEYFKSAAGKKVLIHGGGKKATELARRLGVETRMIDGRRVTDAPALEIVTMVYAGLINKNLVAQLVAMDVESLGLTGADLNLVPAMKRKHPTIDYGYVGDFHIHEINTERLEWMLEGGVVPVCCALTHDQHGSLLNTNADTMAAGIASSLVSIYNVSLYYCFEKKGVLLDLENEVHIPELTFDAYQDLKEKKVISEGMIPKLDNAFNALHAGVSRVVIGNVNGIPDFEGTQLVDN